MITISELRSVIDRALFECLAKLDAAEAERVRQGRCPYCGGRLHRADYPRKPRGIDDLAEEDQWRISFCCAECRRRTTPASLRFLGRKVYAAVVVVAACLLREGGELVRRVIGVWGAAMWTIRRWMRWWAVTAVSSGWWKEARAHVMPPADETKLLASLCARFGATTIEPRGVLKRILRFVSPLTVPGAYPS